MPTALPLRSVLRLCDPRRRWPWPCEAPRAATLAHLLEHAAELASPVEGCGSAAQHIGRIRYLARHGWSDPIEIDVGVPCLGYHGPQWLVIDGNHRLWAATLRGDASILADIAGQVDHAARLFGVAQSAITAGRVELAA